MAFGKQYMLFLDIENEILKPVSKEQLKKSLTNTS